MLLLSNPHAQGCEEELPRIKQTRVENVLRVFREKSSFPRAGRKKFLFLILHIGLCHVYLAVLGSLVFTKTTIAIY